MNDTQNSKRSAVPTAHWLGWDGAFLPRVADWLVGQHGQDPAANVDFSGDICVLPTSRGAARLRELLRDEAEQRDCELKLPELITIGGLPEKLYEPPLPVALEFEQTLAWARVMRSAGPEALRPLIPTPPSSESLGGWLELAATVRRLHEDLSANGLSFQDVANAAESKSEQSRWDVLRKLRNAYLAILADAGLSDPHIERQNAVQSGACRSTKRIVLVGTSDMSKVVTEMLHGVDANVAALIAAPESESDRFDSFGSVVTEAWLDHHLPIQDEQLVSADDVHDQAMAVTESIAEFGKRYRIDQVTLGVTDESLVVPLETQMRSCDVTTHRHLGWSVSDTAVGRLLRLTSAYLAQQTWRSLAALVRHSDVHRMITTKVVQETDVLTRLDEFIASHFPVNVADELSEQALVDFADVLPIRDAIKEWLSCFDCQDQSMGQWCESIEKWLGQTFASLDIEPDALAKPLWFRPAGDRERTRRAMVQTKNLLRRFVDLNAELDVQVSGDQVLELISQRVSDLRVQEDSNDQRLKILGWLDLALDDSPAVVVMGLNHPFVPESTTSDPFLPGSLRTMLRMSDNDRRYARDCYAMHLMITSRPDIHFIVGRRGADSSPTPPSRLLAAADPVDVSRRIGNLLGAVDREVLVKTKWDDGPQTTVIPVPSLGDLKPIDVMSVTGFKEYLNCPYRFYLRRIWRAGPLDDQSHELAANQFGDLIHDTLEIFGKSDAKDETDAKKIADALITNLHGYFQRRYGPHCSAAVKMQLLQAEQRLLVVAKRQSEWRHAGWRLVHAEKKIDEKTGGQIIVDGQPMGIRGRFDRIDYNDLTGQWAVLDYKTHGHKPEKKHLKKTGGKTDWVDLQLPLYRLLLKPLGIDAEPSEVQLGYFNISDTEADTRVNLADFSEAQMGEAIELIDDCVRRIRSGDFAPTTGLVEFDDYPMILQTGIASRMLGAESVETVEVAS